MRHSNLYVSSSPQLSGLPPHHRRAAVLGGPGISGCQVKEDAVLDLGGSEVPEEKERVRALISALHHRVKFFTD